MDNKSRSLEDPSVPVIPNILFLNYLKYVRFDINTAFKLSFVNFWLCLSYKN